jgi:hypothetical protein
MSGKARLALFAPWAFALAFCAGASAQEPKGERKAVETHTIHGVIAGVTVEGELAVDYRTRRAVQAEATLLSVVGSPRHHHEAAQNEPKEEAAHRHHHHHNLYVVVMSPRTEVRDARPEDGKPKEEGIKNAKPSTLDALEIGDHVEVTFAPREEDKSNTGADQGRRARHGRHRIYFGDAISVTIMPQSPHDGHESSARGEPSQSQEKEPK